MDPLSISAAIAGLVSFADLVFRTTTRYVRQAKESSKEVETLRNELQHFIILLHRLSLVAYDLENTASASNIQPRKPNLTLNLLFDCQKILARIQESVESTEQKFHSPSRIKRVQTRLRWPFSASETKELVQSMQRHKEIIDLAVNADTLENLMDCLATQKKISNQLDSVQATVREILDIETKIALDRTTQEVLEFFARKIDNRSVFDIYRSRRHPLTCLWFTQSQVFQEWQNSPGSRLWISGIPGGGKSVISSIIIAECLQLTGSNHNSSPCQVAVAYFFCSYRDETTQDIRNIFSSLASQIARQDTRAFQVLREYYEGLKSHSHVPGNPSTKSLTDILARMAQSFAQLYIIVDGLDECGDDSSLVAEALSRLAQDTKRITMALLSRNEIHIREILEEKFEHMEVEAHNEDVQLYIATELEQRITSKKLRLRDMALKDEIILQLVQEARGMFRLVTCQIDHLCELPTNKARRIALKKLPPTLYSTYERILNKVQALDKQVQTMVQRTLLLINSPYNLTIKGFCEAVSVPDDADTFEEDDVIDEREIRLRCSSLIRTSPDGNTLEFTHSTVLEFLRNACSTHPTLNFYHVSREKTQLLLGQLCLKYLTFKNYERYPEANNSETSYIAGRNNSRPFYEFAATRWRECVTDHMENDSIFRLLVVLFDARKSASFQAWALELVRHCLVNNRGQFCYNGRTDSGKCEEAARATISALLRPDFTTLHMAAALGLPGICQHLLERGADVDIKSRYGTPLHCAVGNQAVFADIDVLHHDFDSSFYSEIYRRGNDPEARHRTVQILLEAGASVLSRFSSPFWSTSILGLSLSRGMYSTDFMTIGDLIKAGAEVCGEDLDRFQEFLNYQIKICCHDIEHGYIYLRDAFGIQEDVTSARFRLFELVTSRLAQKMGLNVPDQVFSHYATLGASQDLVRDFLWNTINNNDTNALRKFIDSGGSDQVKSIRKLKLAEDENWTLLHQAVRSGAVNCFKLLLEVGCPVDSVLADGSTLAHLCCEDRDEDFLRVMIEHHICTTVQDHELNTPWHLAAASNSTKILRLLLTIEGEKKTALGLKSKDGQTPLRVSLAKGHKESVLILMQYCPSPDFWESDSHLFRDAASIGSAEIVHKLLDVGFGLDPVDANSESPLHSIGPNTSIECATLLVELFSHCQLRTKDRGEIPLEAFLDKASRQLQPVNHDIFEIFKILLTDVDISGSEYGPHLWQTMCRAIVTAFLDKEDLEYKWKQMFDYIVDRGALLAYEAANNIPALKPLATEIIFATKRQDHDGAKDRSPRLPGSIKPENILQTFNGNLWPTLSGIVLGIEAASSCWDGVAKDASLTQLLSQAVLQDDTRLIQCLLKHGVDPELRIDSAMSALELACSPEAPISEGNFRCLLSEYKSFKLAENGKKLDTLGLLYLPGDEATWKLRRLLEAGLSCDHRPAGFVTLPLNWCIYKGYSSCAEVLLEFGANPWLTDMDGFDAVLRAVCLGSSSLLSLIATISFKRNLLTNWDRKFVTTEHDITFVGASGLHVASALGRIDCLRFYFDRNLLVDPEVTDSAMNTPIHYAARFGQSGVVEFLRDRGSNINAAAHGGLCPLHLAVQGQHLHTVRVLVSLGAELKACGSGLTPLAYAYQTGNMALIQLLQATQDNNTTRQILTQPKPKGLLRSMAKAWRNALDRNDIEACKHLLSQGCPVDIQLDEPWPVTPLMCAICTSRRLEIVGCLIDQGARVSTVFYGKRMPPFLTGLEAAAAKPMYNDLLPKIVAKYLEEKGELLTLSRSPLSSAVSNNNYVGLEVLLQAIKTELVSSRQTATRGDDPSSFLSKLVNQPDLEDCHITTLHKAAMSDADGCAKMLLKASADVHSMDTDGHTPLHFAAQNGSLKVGILLMESGANPCALTRHGHSPVMLACGNGHFDMVKLLSSSNGNWQSQVDVFQSNLAYAAIQNATHNHIRIWDFILAQDIDPYQLNADGHSAAHYAMSRLSQTYLRVMLRRHIDVIATHNFNWDIKKLNRVMSIRTSGGTTTALINITKSYHLISRCLSNQHTPVYSNSVTTGEDSLLYQSASLGVVEALDNFLAVGVDLEWECCDKGTVLMIAAANGQLEAVKYLVRKGARLGYMTNGHEWSVVDAARGHQRVIDWLLVGMFSDQHKLTGSAFHEEGVIQAWSGVTSLPIPMKWEWRQMRDESLFEYAKRLQTIRKRVVVVSTHPDEGIVTEYKYPTEDDWLTEDDNSTEDESE
ncbi:hypothetical protein F5Y01DRAFT_321618 [Xylaria sp. FL0043]|nr:hypothetical protein F5Y01DRAFT_321618 [Xylaria sp. FL0043]